LIIELDDLTIRDVYKLLSGSVVPRPIAWVSTVSRDGIRNLAPFSFFTVASWNPPTLCFSIGPGVNETRAGPKDTLVNIQETRQFVVNVVTYPLAEQMQRSSANFAPEVDEFEVAGVTPVAGRRVAAPRVLEAPIQMECELDRIVEVGANHLVLGRLVCYHIRDDCYLGDCKVDIKKLQPVGRLAGNYVKIDTFFELPIA